MLKKPAAALLFIPLFFVFSFLHEYRVSGNFSTPSHTATADNGSSDIYSQSDSNHNDFFNWQNYKNNIQNALGGHTDTNTASNNSTFSTNSNNVTARENQPADPNTFVTIPTPGVPNTGGLNSTYTPTSTYTNTPSPPAPIPTPMSPPTTIYTTPINPISITTFPQSSPPPTPPPPPPVTPAPENSTSSNQTNTQATTTSSPTPPPIIPPVTLIIPTSTNTTTTPSTESSGATVSTPPVAIPPIITPPSPPPPPAPSSTPATSSDNGSSTPSSTAPHDQNQGTGQTSSGTPTTLPPPPPPSPQPVGGVFDTGGVTFRFDDGWQSQYDIALPALQAAGIQATFYIVTQQLLDDQYSGFMSRAEVKKLAADGEEVGAHTQTHPHLPTLSSAEQKKEIDGSKADLQGWGINALTFSYPYGEYTSATMQLVKSAGFTSAVSTIESAATKNSDRYQIEGPSLVNTDTPAAIEQMIQTAVNNHQWLVLTFHRIDTSDDQYSMTPSNFKQIVDYIHSHQIPTFTVSQGAASLAQQ